MRGFMFRLPSYVRCADPAGVDDNADDGAGGGGGGSKEVDNFDHIMNQEIFTEDDLTPPDEGDKDKQELKEGDKKDKKEGVTLESIAAELAEVKKKNTELEKAARRAFYAERHERKPEKKDQEEVTLSDAEIKAIMKEHKDDPEVIFNAVTYKVQQMMKGGVKSAVNEVETKNKQEKLTNLLRDRFGEDYDDDSSEVRKSISKTKTALGLDDHPYGDFLAYGASIADVLPNLAKQWYEKGKKDALGKSADENREKDVEDGQLTPKGRKEDGPKDKKTGLSSTQMETAKLMGFDRDPKKMKIYADQILKRSRAAA